MYKNSDSHLWNMDEALKEADKAYREDEVPIGAVIVDGQGNIISRAHNQKEKSHNPCGHAEILAIQEACQKLANWRLLECSIYVTLEPCPMCMSALQQSRIKNIYFGAYDQKGGALSLNFNLHQNPKLNHNINIIGGIRHFESSRILSVFFREKRKAYNKY